MQVQQIAIEAKAVTQVKVLGTRCGIVFDAEVPTASGRIMIAATGSPESLSLFVEIMMQRRIAFTVDFSK